MSSMIAATCTCAAVWAGSGKRPLCPLGSHERALSARELADAGFARGDRVQTPDGRQGSVRAVNVHAAAVVSVQLDGAFNLSPWLFFDLTNITREGR